MAYFDSSKNRAKWEIELAALRKERKLREQGGGNAPNHKEMDAGQKPMVVRMTYQELLKEEAEASRREPAKARPEMAAEKGPKEKSEMVYGKN